MRKQRTSPSVYTVFANIPTYIYLVMIPVVQNYLFDPKGFFERFASYSVSLMMTAAAAVFSAAGFAGQHVEAGTSGVTLRRGVFIKRKCRFPYSRLRSASFAVSPTMRLFSAVRVTLSSARRDERHGTFYLPRDTAEALKTGMLAELGERVTELRAKNGRLLLAAALLSNPLAGLIAIVPFLRGVGRAAGEQARSELMRSLDFSQLLVLLGISPTAAFLAYFLLACTVVSALRTFVITFGQRALFYERGAVVSCGLVTRRETLVPLGKSACLTVTRTLPMLPLRLCSCFLSPRRMGEKGRVLAASAVDNKTAERLTYAVFGEKAPRFTAVERPGLSSLPRFAAAPGIMLLMSAALLPAAVRAGVFAKTVVLMLAALVAAASVWLLFSLYGFRFVETARGGGFVRVRRIKRLTLIEEIYRE